MSCQYTVREDRIVCEGRSYIVYGIEVVTPDGTPPVHLRALYADRGRAEALVALCNRLGLSPCHLSDIAEDLLAK